MSNIGISWLNGAGCYIMRHMASHNSHSDTAETVLLYNISSQGDKKTGSKGNGNKPLVWVDGGLHAREWITVASAMYFAKDVSSYNHQLRKSYYQYQSSP